MSESEQLTIADVHDVPHARSSDLDTSKRAAEAIEASEGTTSTFRPQTTKHQALELIGRSNGLTALEVERLNMTGKSGLWKRVSDLKNANLIKASGERVDPVTHRAGTVWVINGRGRAVLAQLNAGRHVRLRKGVEGEEGSSRV